MMLLSVRQPFSSLGRTVTLGALWTAIACTAPAPSGGPANPDRDGDGIKDTLLDGRCLFDPGGDGVPDATDLDLDGSVEGPGFDVNCDGVADGYGVDSDHDGIIDTIQLAEGGSVKVTEPPPDDMDGILLGTGGGTAEPPDGETKYCQDFDVDFVPKTPTVLVLVDRSSSMFTEPTNFWVTLKAAVLPVIEGLQADVRFGFASYTGSVAACTGLSSPTPFAFDNYAAIQSAYDALGAPSEKGETPTAAAIEQAAALLLADDSPGDRYILLVTDGDPDFCDDPPKECGADALVASLQVAASQGVRTLVFGIENKDIEDPARFDYFAQAGMGELPNWDMGVQGELEGQYSGVIESACKNTGGGEWARYRTLNGNEPPVAGCPHDYMDLPPYSCFLPAGKYSTAGGTAKAFLSTDTAALATQIQATVSGLKSCIFDLSESGVEVIAGQEAKGEIFVNEIQVPADQWRMNTTQELELLGAACSSWQDPTVTKFFAGFPCEALNEVVK